MLVPIKLLIYQIGFISLLALAVNGQSSKSVESLQDEHGKPLGLSLHVGANQQIAEPVPEMGNEPPPFDELFVEEAETIQQQKNEEGRKVDDMEQEHVHGFIKNESITSMDVKKESNGTVGHAGVLPPQQMIPQQLAEFVPPQLCPASVEMPTFLRHQSLASGLQGMNAANFVRKMDSLEACARLCRENVEPFGGRHFGCHGFTYASHKNTKNNICEFFDDHLAAALENKPPIGVEKNPLPEQHLSLKSYFERICLPLSSRCSRFTFVFEVYPRRKFVGIPPIHSEDVDDRKRCLEFCLGNERCRSVDFDTENLTCHLFAHSKHWMLGANHEKELVGELAESADLDHYENTCLLNLDRCANRHLAFVLIRNAESSRFSVGLGKLPISDCLTRCLDSPPAFCRSVQFRSSSGDCFLGTERAEQPIPSDETDIYEPICLPDPPSTSTLECLGEHVFERVPNMELRADQGDERAEGIDIGGIRLEECLDACILDETCQSFNYRAASVADDDEGEATANCRLFTFNRTDNRTLSVLIQGVDFYELACARILFSTKSPNATQQLESTKSAKKDRGKEKAAKKPKQGQTTQIVQPTTNTPLPEQQPITASTVQRNQSESSWQIATQNCPVEKIGVLLEKGCTLRTEYRQQHHVNVRNLEQCQRTCIQANTFHCTAFSYSQKTRDCLLSSTRIDNETNEYTLFTQRNQNFELFVVREEKKCPIEENGNVNLSGRQTTLGIAKKASSSSNNFETATTLLVTTPTTPSTTTTTTTSTKTTPLPTTMQTESSSSPSTDTPKVIAPETTMIPPEVVQSTMVTASRNINGQLTHQTRLSPHQVHASALCDSQGVNITFRLIDGSVYSGAVYAADRFTQCRLFVENKSEFFFFVNRPNHHQQNWCNVQENDGQLNIMLVLSNDVGVPLEVTTKDDLFFYISCNHAFGAPAKDGIVVSGLGIGAELSRVQEQVAQMELQQHEKRKEDKRVKLKITKNGKPVNNVFIGEHLVAIVESNDLSVGTFRVADCNATRVSTLDVAGREFTPPGGSIPLLDRRGCSLLPQIIGDMRRIDDHLEAPLTAFRIDGSSELDIICSVIICRTYCVQQPEQCENKAGRIGRMAEKQMDDEEGDKIIVDQRIRVLVLKDETGENRNELDLTSGRKQLAADQQKRIDFTNAILEADDLEETRLAEGNPNFGGNFKATNGDVCLNPLLLLLLAMFLVLALVALFISLLTHWCRRKNARTNFYPTSTFSTELSSHHFHIPRILDSRNAYMG